MARGGPGKGGAGATCLLGPRSVPRCISHQLPWSRSDNLCFSVLPKVPCTRGHSKYFKRQRKMEGEDQTMSPLSGSWRCQRRRGREPGPCSPGLRCLDSEDLVPLLLHLWPAGPKLFLDCPLSQMGSTGTQLSSQDLSLWAAVAGASTRSPQRPFEAQQGARAEVPH